MDFAVTGTSRLLTPEEQRYVQRIVKRTLLKSRGDVNKRRATKHTLASGMAFGVDTQALLAVWGLLPFEQIRCIVPGTCIHNRPLVEKAAGLGAEIIIVQNRHTVSETYMARNDRVVAPPTRALLAFPNTPDEEARSGTWATIRRARKAGIRIRIYPLSSVWE